MARNLLQQLPLLVSRVAEKVCVQLVAEMHEGGVSKFTVHPIYAKSTAVPFIEKCTAQWGRQHKHKHNQIRAHKIKRKTSKRWILWSHTKAPALWRETGALWGAGKLQVYSEASVVWQEHSSQCAERHKPKEIWILHKKSWCFYCSLRCHPLKHCDNYSATCYLIHFNFLPHPRFFQLSLTEMLPHSEIVTGQTRKGQQQGRWGSDE